MTAEIATLERVVAAASELRDNGVRPTADRVIARIGGGSKSTVLQHLRAIRDCTKPPEQIPPEIMDAIRPAVAAVFNSGRSAGAEASRAATERFSAVVAELDEQIEELANDNSRLELAIADAIEASEVARSKIAQLEEDVRRGDARIAELRSMLTGAKPADEALLQALAKVEGMLARTGDRSETRKTISLPRKPTGRR